MKRLIIITAIYLMHYQVKAQIIFPDSLYVENFLPPRRIAHSRTNTVINTFENLPQETLEYDKYIEQLISNGISKLAMSINNFYLNHKDLGNVAFSPVSIAGALALLLMGSNGKTFDEIVSAMGLAEKADIRTNSQIIHESLGKIFFKLHQSSNFTEQIKVATAMFVQNNFRIRDLYKYTSERIYNNEILNLDFRNNNLYAQRVINAWISNKTNGKIKSILAEPPSEDTRVIVVSALYFNGAWEKQFWEGLTRRRPFYPNGRKSYSNIEVDMMSNGGQFPYYKDQDCEIMGFPYKGNVTTMYVVIPHNSNIQRLKSFEASLTFSDIIRLIESTSYTQSTILFPKIKLEVSNDLRQPLQNLGINSLFSPLESNLALLSRAAESAYGNKVTDINEGPINPTTPVTMKFTGRNMNDVLIFSRFGIPLNCTQIFNPYSNISECQEIDRNSQKQITYKKFGDKLGRRVTRETIDTLDKLRAFLNRDPHNKNLENPGLYVDQVLHKVYIDVTEKGTEAAASTSVSLTRGGDITIFRADIPFLFFIWHEETKLILFWGTVYEPKPYSS